MCVGRRVCLVLAGSLSAQQADEFSRKNTWTVFAEYSNTSSPILMGSARQRKLADLGGAYTRRVVRFWGSDLSYQVEVRPVMFESDPVQIIKETTTLQVPNAPVTTSETSTTAVVGPCRPSSSSISFPPSNGFPGVTENFNDICGRQWTFAQAFSPLGFKYSMRTRHPVQLLSSERWVICIQAARFRLPMPRRSTSYSTLALVLKSSARRKGRFRWSAGITTFPIETQRQRILGQTMSCSRRPTALDAR